MSEQIHISFNQPNFFRRFMKRGLKFIFFYFFLFIVFVSDNNNQNSQNDTWVIVAVLTFVFGLLFWSASIPTKYALTNLDTDSKGLYVKYFDKDEVKEETITWAELYLDKHFSFSKPPVRAIVIGKNNQRLASFYAIHPLIDNKYIDNLCDNLQQLKKQYTNE